MNALGTLLVMLSDSASIRVSNNPPWPVTRRRGADPLGPISNAVNGGSSNSPPPPERRAAIARFAARSFSAKVTARPATHPLLLPVTPLGRIPMVPRHSKQREAAPSRETAIPQLTNTGDGPKGPDRSETAGNPVIEFDPQHAPADRIGRSSRRLARRSTDEGTPRERCRRRPQGWNGCEEDDRSSDPRFRSAPTDQQASVEREIFL